VITIMDMVLKALERDGSSESEKARAASEAAIAQVKITEAAAFLDRLAHELDGDENVLADRCRAMAAKLRAASKVT
jgi:hypothetical protein